MRLKAEIHRKKPNIKHGSLTDKLSVMSKESEKIGKILQKFQCENISVAINPSEGFVFKFECRIGDAENIFREINSI